MDILVTGSNGFLAKNIITKLKNYNFITVSRNELDLTNKIEVDKFFQKNFFDVVINTAIVGGRRSIVDSKDIFYDNVLISMNIAENRASYKKLIHFGSGAELDRSKEINESSNILNSLPIDPYGLSKNIISRLFEKYDNFYNLRLFNVFAENEEKNRMIASNVNNYINRSPIVIHQDRYMDFIYIDDFLNILEMYINYQDLPTTIDCVYESKYKLSDIANIINNLSNYKVDVNILDENLGLSYCGKNTDLGLAFDGLEFGVKELYKIISKEI
jgi:GDP-L-fucose synthase